MNRIMTIVAAGLLSATFTACNKDKYTPETAHPGDNKHIMDAAKKTGNTSIANELESDFSGTHMTGTDLNWKGGYCIVNRVKMQAILPGTGTIKYQSEHDLRHMDLNTPQIINKIALPYGEYKKIKYTIDLAPSENQGNSFYLSGTFTDNGKPYKVRFVINKPIEIKLQEKDVAIFNTDDQSTVFTLQIKEIGSGITASMLHTAATNTTGDLIIVSENANTDIYNAMTNNLDKSFSINYKK